MATPKVLEARVTGRQSDIPRHPRVELATVKSVLQKRPSHSEPYFVSGDSRLLEVLQLMDEHDIRALPVWDRGRLSGFFSERDYIRHSIRVASTGMDASVRELMTPCAISARPTDSIQSCLTLMSENGLRHLPIQEESAPIAIVSLDELLKEMVAYLERVCHETEMDQQILFLRGTYSC